METGELYEFMKSPELKQEQRERAGQVLGLPKGTTYMSLIESYKVVLVVDELIGMVEELQTQVRELERKLGA